MNERYKNLKTELLLNNKDEAKVKEYKKVFNDYYKDLELQYNNSYSKQNNLALTLNKEQERLTILIGLIKNRIKEVSILEKEYKKITLEGINSNHILGLNNLESYQQRLININLYLECLEEYKKLKQKNEELTEQLINDSSNKDNISLQIKETEEKVSKLIKKITIPEIISILYEFCIIDTYNINKLNKENLFNERKDIIIHEEKIIEKEVFVPLEEEKKSIESIPIIDKLGTVQPVSKIKEIENIQKEHSDINLPDFGINSQNPISLDNQQYLKGEK